MNRAAPLVAGLVTLLLGAAAHAKDPPPPSTKQLPHFSHHSHANLPLFRDQIAAERRRGVVAAGATDVDFLPCAQCHALEKRTGEPLPPGADGHKPCADLRCHGPRLDKLALPTGGALCTECHEKAEKFAVSPPRFVKREETDREFGWRINHRRHLQLEGLDRCDSCHKLIKAVTGDEVTVTVHAPSHAECAPCHGKAGSKPSLAQCNACHLIGEAPKPRVSVATAFRVYEKFTHDTHRLDVRTAHVKPGGVGRGWARFDRATAQTLSCGACHSTAARAESIREMDLLGPCAMNKTCMGQCHNGKFAFGNGNNDCLLCHSKEAETAKAPASHCGG